MEFHDADTNFSWRYFKFLTHKLTLMPVIVESVLKFIVSRLCNLVVTSGIARLCAFSNALPFTRIPQKNSFRDLVAILESCLNIATTDVEHSAVDSL